MRYGAISTFLRKLAQPVVYLGIGMLVFVYASVAYLAINDRSLDEQLAERRASNIVRIIDKSISFVFQSVDSNLLSLREIYQLDPAAFDISAWANNTATKNDLVLHYTIIGANGRILDTTSGKERIGANLKDLDAYKNHVDSPFDRLVIGKPLVGRWTGSWIITASRKIIGADGKFAGVVVAIINPIGLGTQFGGADLGANGTIAIIGFDGYVRARAVEGIVRTEYFGDYLPPGTGVIGQVARQPAGSYWAKPAAIDHVNRLAAYRVIGSFPLIALVSIIEEEVYRRANGNANIYAGAVFVLTIFIIIVMAAGLARNRQLREITASLEAAKEELQQSQERYTQVERAVNDGIWDRNLLTGEGFYSARWQSMLGYPKDGPPNATSLWYELIHPDDRAAVAEAVRAHLEEEVPYKIEYRLLRKDGSYCWVQSRGKAIRDATNRPIRMVGTITDITERKQAEALIEESRNNLEHAERMALLGHYKYTIGSDRLTWSESVYRILGKSPASFTPTLNAVRDVYLPDDRQILEEYRRNVLAGIDLPSITLRAKKEDGRTIHVEVWSVPTRAADGTVTGMFGTIQDVTARKQSEVALAKANRELEERVAERTAELAQEMRRREEAQVKLAQVQKMEAVGQLTAGIAHDFNNLLAVISGGLEFVEDSARRGLPAEPELIDAAQRATWRGRELVQRLLTFSRQAPLKAETTIVDQLVLDTLRLLQRTLGEGVDIVTRLDTGGATANLDRNQLTNALLNLAVNARDAMPNGGTLNIETKCQPARSVSTDGATRWPTGEEICITVRDTGVGMTEEVRRHAFEPFFTTKPDGLGTGLGLSMVHGFVEQSGGHVEIESVVGNGATITIHLPKIGQMDPQSAEFGIGAAPAMTQGEKTVLLVEDDPDVRTVLSAQLRQLGHKVCAVANATEALHMIESPSRIDITLTDVVLPGGIDGVTLIKEAMHRRPRMGILCMSGYNPTQTHRKWLRIQNIELLEKPFSSARLAEAIKVALGERV